MNVKITKINIREKNKERTEKYLNKKIIYLEKGLTDMNFEINNKDIIKGLRWLKLLKSFVT